MNSVYIHIPFCNKICSYCAFTKYLYNEKYILKYLNSLEQEIKNNYKGELIKTLYIGGGTPSALTIKELHKLFNIIEIFNLSDNLEFTIEINPESIDKDKLLLFKKNKVNRISIGVESTNSKYLNYLNRQYDYNLIKEKINLIKELGFYNVNVDLIYGIKNQTMNDLGEDLNNILKLNIEHISTYSLMIEPHTLLFIKNTKPIDEDKDYLMYKLICNTLKSSGFNHYEISNFAKDGYESKHNLVYWNNQNYYGFGLGASGYINNIRYNNTTNLKKYLLGNYLKDKEIMAKKDIISYELILGFRKIKGINKKEFKKKYNLDIKDLYNIRELLISGDLKENKDYIFINYDKIYIENSILINFVGE